MEITDFPNSNVFLQNRITRISTKIPTPQELLIFESPDGLEYFRTLNPEFPETADEDEIESARQYPTTPTRVAVLGQSKSDVFANLWQEKFLSIKPVRITPAPKIAFLFTGQGSQYGGMGRALYESSEIFREAFDSCADRLDSKLPIPLAKVIWGHNSVLLEESRYSQTALFCIEIALVALWKSLGVTPDFVLGPSAGGFAAAVTAGIMSKSDGLTMIAERSRLIQKLPTGGMTSVKAPLSVVRKMIQDPFILENGGWLDVAVINSPDDIVVAGRPESLTKFEQLCTDNGFKNLRLAAGQAFHSREIEGILDNYGKILENIQFNPPTCDYISGVTGKIAGEAARTTEYWKSHARDPVDFPAAVDRLWTEGARIFIEIGPQPTLMTVGRHNVGAEKAGRSIWLPSLRRKEMEWMTFLTNLGHLWVEGINVCGAGDTDAE